MYRAVTRRIEVTVEPNYLPERSSAENRQYFWSYTVVITNSGEETVKLRTRHWVITDASGRTQEVRGEGVVGVRRQPRIVHGAQARVPLHGLEQRTYVIEKGRTGTGALRNVLIAAPYLEETHGSES